MTHANLLKLLAGPAVAGLLLVGCDDQNDTATNTGTTGSGVAGTDAGDATMDRARTAGGAAGGAQVSDAQVEQLSQSLEDAQEAAEAYKDRIEAMFSESGETGVASHA